ncbi:hypothetical protein [Halomonas sp. N3-2A]|uniref:hypothetical protein n=1 Tax=Halomonas sp. N3-2A TaxID=2014541 RepID=UPI000B5B17FE|nr:hypothetical protein [Halomonas sp. N3-2A]ASK18384.1 hypothetical protein CEK60_03265 [Halomonas sp. N3-2A]
MARGGWSMPLSAFIPQIENKFLKLRNQIAAEALQLLQFGSPVDQGTYRANHRISIGDRDMTFELVAGSSAPKGSIDQQVYDREVRKLLTENAPFTIVYIQQNLPYAQRIEDGWSQQAGEGVYAAAASALRSKYGGG